MVSVNSDVVEQKSDRHILIAVTGATGMLYVQALLEIMCRYEKPDYPWHLFRFRQTSFSNGKWDLHRKTSLACRDGLQQMILPHLQHQVLAVMIQ